MTTVDRRTHLTVHADAGPAAEAAVTTTERQVTRHLDPTFGAVPVARETTREALGVWGMSAIFDDIALVVTELVTNALQHGLHLTPPPAQETFHPRQGLPMTPIALHTPSPEPRLELTLTHTPSSLVCTVSDPDPEPPRLRTPSSPHGSGWGLHLVDSLTTSWGCAVLPPGQGVTARKIVWALFALPLVSSRTRSVAHRTRTDPSPAHASQRAEGTIPCGFDVIPERVAPSWPHWPRLANPA